MKSAAKKSNAQEATQIRTTGFRGPDISAL